MHDYRIMGEGGSAARMAMRLVFAFGLISGVTHATAQPRTQTQLTSQSGDVQVTQQDQQAMPAQLQTPQTPQTPQTQTQTQAQIQPAPVPPVTQIGDATASLLALQRDGQAAAPAQPMLGAEASAAYARYLRSFGHEIPEQSTTAVGTGGNSAANSGTGG